ncbi:MAG: hypothetical protein H5T50_07115 [Nitrososphaeria archaeon]|nr:hypothetical protein [Nitrososphaeria archaeon]
MSEEDEFDFDDRIDLDFSRFTCPECGELLSLVAFIYRNGHLGIEVTCEWCDYVGFEVELECKKSDLRRFRRRLGVFKATLQELRKPC